jgi:hypothetical protein
MAHYFPCARRDELLIKDVVDEVLIYDQLSHEAHCLNPTAAAIWRACDGTVSAESIAAIVTKQHGNPCDESTVWYALEQLHERNLLEGGALPPKGSSRRELVKHLGMAAVLITSILAPTAAMAGSCGPQGPQGCDPCGPQGPQCP